MSDIRAALEDKALHNTHGVISRAEALEAGCTIAQVDRRVRRRQWRPSGFRDRLILAAAWDDPLAHLTCAIDALDGIAWRQTALALHAVAPHPPKPEILTTHRGRTGAATIARYDPVVWRVVVRNGFRCLTLEDAVASMAGVRRRDAFDELIDSLLRANRTSWPRLAEAFTRVRRRGRRGSALLGLVLEERRSDQNVPLSVWSRKFARAMSDAGLAPPRMEWRVEREGRLVAQVDLAYPELRYAIELDSVAFHLNPEAFEEDRRRDADLAAEGWLVRRFTWNQFADRLVWVLQVIRTDLEQRRRATGSSDGVA